MNARIRSAIALIALAAAAQAGAQVVFYEHENFQGRSFTAARPVGDVGRYGFGDRASSAVVTGDRWEVCSEARFGGDCVVLRRGQYPSLRGVGMNDRVLSVRPLVRSARVDDRRYVPMPMPIAPAPDVPSVTFYENNDFRGRSFTTEEDVRNFDRFGFNDRASSVVVSGASWEVCDALRYDGRCVVLRPGRYPSLAAMGLNDRVSSTRLVSGSARADDAPRYAAAAPVPVYDARRRPDERLFEAPVTSVRAVVGNAGQHCWVERGQVVEDRGAPNVPGAVIGAVIGGILGHQVGGGTGRDVATVGGAVAGGAIGANVGRDGRQVVTPDVQRCRDIPGRARADYWDVTYTFRGLEHRVQMTAPPGDTVTVNEQGEPRAS